MAFWDKLSTRGNVQDRRAKTAITGGIGITGLLLLMGVNYLLGGNPLDVLLQVDPNSVYQEEIDTTQFEGNDSYENFASVVLGSNNEFWKTRVNNYSEPTLVLFRNTTESGCGYASSQMGPHYCPLDKTIYLDETFFDELTNRLGAEGGDVAEAYVIAHEVGHHVQHEQGDLESNMQDSINVELQADCLAGMWAGSLKELGILEPGEIEEAMNAAASVGDDNIQEETGQVVNPETWTHGSSAERVYWFNRGYESERIDNCNTFAL